MGAAAAAAVVSSWPRVSSRMPWINRTARQIISGSDIGMARRPIDLVGLFEQTQRLVRLEYRDRGRIAEATRGNWRYVPIPRAMIPSFVSRPCSGSSERVK